MKLRIFPLFYSLLEYASWYRSGDAWVLDFLRLLVNFYGDFSSGFSYASFISQDYYVCLLLFFVTFWQYCWRVCPFLLPLLLFQREFFAFKLPANKIWLLLSSNLFKSVCLIGLCSGLYADIRVVCVLLCNSITIWIVYLSCRFCKICVYCVLLFRLLLSTRLHWWAV